MLKQFLSLLFAALFLSSALTASAEEAPTFVDVPDNSPFYEAVRWAYPNGVTKGTDATHFNPTSNCTRGEVLTFIWRACNCPASAGTQSLEDAKGYYEQAANWAFVNGYEPGEYADGGWYFYGNRLCTRMAAITYLWRVAGRPVVSIDEVRIFYDIPSDSSEESVTTLQAVAWAVQKGIAKGTSSTTFSPDAICTRGQIVTFLYRYYEAGK